MKVCSQCNIEKPIDNFWKKRTKIALKRERKNWKSGFRSECKSCCKDNAYNYTNTEKGFMNAIYHNIRNTAKNKRKRTVFGEDVSGEPKEKYKYTITKEEFFELWEEHKKKFGYHCHLTGIKIICQRAKYKNSFVGYPNGLSVDRLDPEIGYTKENIIFISNVTNKRKGAVTKELCKSILKIYEEKNL